MAKTSLSGLDQFVRALGDEPVWIGVDVHKETYSASLVSTCGARRTWSCRADPDGFVKQLMGFGVSIALVAHEAGPTGFALARCLEKAGLPALVAAPSRIPRPVTAGAKTDSLDSLKLAELAMGGQLRPITIPTEAEEAQRSLIRRIDQIGREVRRTKQRIKSLLLEFGLEEPKGLKNWSKKSVSALKKIKSPGGVALAFGSHLRELEWHIGERNRVMEELKKVLKRAGLLDRVRKLRSAPGVGPLTAQTFCLEVFRPERFARGEELTSYLGLAPMIRHSGSGQKRAYIRPVGQKRLRSLLIEAAWVWVRKDEHAAAIYRRLVSKSGVAQKEITALARRLAVILWRMCLENREYRPGVSAV